MSILIINLKYELNRIPSKKDQIEPIAVGATAGCGSGSGSGDVVRVPRGQRDAHAEREGVEVAQGHFLRGDRRER